MIRFLWAVGGFSLREENVLRTEFRAAISEGMNSHDEHTQPDDVPEPSEEELMEDFAELKKLLANRPEDSDEMARISNATIVFFEKHRRRLEERDLGVEEILADLKEGRAKHQASCQKVDETMDAFLHAKADVADKMLTLAEGTLAAMHQLHLHRDDLEYLQREKVDALIEDYKDNRESFLADLPIAERRRLEALYPQWW